MPPTAPERPANRARLEQLMEERRRELRMTWVDVRAAAGIGDRTLYNVRKGSSGIDDSTQAGIEAALRWAPGSIRAILGAGAPAHLEAAPARARPDGPPARREHAPADDPDLAPFIQAVREDLGRAMAAYGPGFTGAQAFSAPHEAETWDDPEGFMPDDGDRVRLIARNRRRAAEWQSEERQIGLPACPASP